MFLKQVDKTTSKSTKSKNNSPEKTTFVKKEDILVRSYDCTPVHKASIAETHRSEGSSEYNLSNSSLNILQHNDNPDLEQTKLSFPANSLVTTLKSKLNTRSEKFNASSD